MPPGTVTGLAWTSMGGSIALARSERCCRVKAEDRCLGKPQRQHCFAFVISLRGSLLGALQVSQQRPLNLLDLGVGSTFQGGGSEISSRTIWKGNKDSSR